MENRVLFINEVAERLRCSRRTIYKRLKAGNFPIPPLPAIDGKKRWSASDVEKFVSSSTAEAPTRARRKGQMR